MKKITIDGKTIEISDEGLRAFREPLKRLGQSLDEYLKTIVASKAWKEFMEAVERLSEEEEEWPKDGDIYWRVYRFDDVDSQQFRDTSESDIFNKSIGNCYRTKTEAKKAFKTGWVAYLQALERVKKYIKDNGLEFEPGWNNNNEAKYHVYYDYQLDKLNFTHSYEAKHNNLPRLRSAEDAKQVMEACKDDYLILLGVKK